MKDEIIRAAGDESYDSSELSEIEFFKSREEERKKDKHKEQDATDKAAFPVSRISWLASVYGRGFCATFRFCFLLSSKTKQNQVPVDGEVSPPRRD